VIVGTDDGVELGVSDMAEEGAEDGCSDSVMLGAVDGCPDCEGIEESTTVGLNDGVELGD
jgi:hypothetical protein